MLFKTIMTGLLFLTISGLSFADNKTNVTVKGDPQLKLTPPDGALKSGSLCVFKIETNGKQVIIKVNSEKVEIRVDSSGTEFTVLFYQPGDYKVWAITSLGDQLLEKEISVTVVKGNDVPDPPVPVVDPLVKKLQDAFNSDNSADKKVNLVKLVQDMRYGADQSAVKSTNSDIVTAVANKTKEDVGDNLIGLRKAIGEYLNGVLPPDNVNMTLELRKKYAAEYNKVADALEKLK